MFRKKNGQEFMDERNVDSSVNDKEEKIIEFISKKIANGKRIHELELLSLMIE